MRTSLLGIFIFFSLSLIAQTTSNGVGNWNAGASWDTGIVPPDNGDTVFIEVGDVISINSNTTYSTSLVIVVRGTLTLNQTLTLPSGSQIVIEPGGLVNSGNNGWRLDIGAMSWKDFKKDPHTGGILTDNALSVKEIAFEIEFNNGELNLYWEIEEGNDKVEKVLLEESLGGEKFEVVKEFDNSLNKSTSMNFDFTSKFVYFRLKVIDEKDITYSKTIKVENTDYKLDVYPNPFKDKILVNNNFNESEKSIKVVDMLGNVVIEQEEAEEVNTSSLESGLYFVHVFENNQLVLNKRMLKK